MNKNLIAAKIRYGMATAQELASVSKDDLRAMKGDESAPHFRFSDGLVPAEKAHGELGEREHEHVMSTERRDSMGDIIRVAGWNLERVKDALPVFYAHDSREIPIGLMKSAKKTKLPDGFMASDERANNKALIGRYTIHGAEAFGEGEAFAQKAAAVQALLEARAIRGGSVGFMPDEIHFPESEEERQKLGLGEYGVLFIKQSLLEWSITPIPANPDAQMLKSAAEESRAAGRTVLKGLVDAGQLLPDAAEMLLADIFTEHAYDFLLAEEKTSVSMEGLEIIDLMPDDEDFELRDADGDELEDEPEEVLLRAHDLREATRNTPETALEGVAQTLGEVAGILAELTEQAKATATIQARLLEQFEELERTASSRDQGGERSADDADADAPAESGTSRSEDPEEFAALVMRDALEELLSDGAQHRNNDRNDHATDPQGESRSR